MFKRSLLLLNLVLVSVAMQAADAPVQSSWLSRLSMPTMPSLPSMPSLKSLVPSINLSSKMSQARQFAGAVASRQTYSDVVQQVRNAEGFKAACNSFISNKPAVVGVLLGTGAVAALGYALYKYLPQYLNTSNNQ